MKILVLVLCFILMGCSSNTFISDGPTYEPIVKKRVIALIYHDNLETIAQVCTTYKGRQTLGCAFMGEKVCTIHLRWWDKTTLAHEIDHCIYGKWHKRPA